MDIYLHDRSAAFQFVLKGKLMGDWVLQLEHAWNTARSVVGGKEVVVDLSGISDADPRGVDLLSRMRDSGARLTASRAPKSEAFLARLGVAMPRSGSGREGWRLLRLFKFAGLCG